ncbi:MAG: hypothetical protein ACTHZ9_09085 [Leucobacter sp.]
MDATTYSALQAIADAHAKLATDIEAVLKVARPSSEALVPPAGDEQHRVGSQAIPWDPEFDAPLMQPKVVGTREEQDWCSLTYLGGIYAINKRHYRGANTAEIREYAVKAGYQDGRAVTAWSKGNGATQNDDDRQRWVTAAGVDLWVKRLSAKLGLTLPADLDESWAPPRFTSAHNYSGRTPDKR